MKQSKDFFWPSYVDLMTALFLTMLVLFVLSYKLFKDREQELIRERNMFQAKAAQLDLIKRIEQSLAAMMADKTLFQYDPAFRRYTLAHDVQFKGGQWDLRKPALTLTNQNDLLYLQQAGIKLRDIVNNLLNKKQTDVSLKDVSYVLAIVGSASDLYKDPYRPIFDNRAYTDYENWNYVLSYQRAKALYDFWKKQGIVDFDAPKYHDVIELVIAGDGLGGVGRYNSDDKDYSKEYLNQRFLIQIIPKIGKVP
jgi:hypothetical protein